MEIKKTIYAIGGGDLRQKTTIELDGIIAEEAKKRAGLRRARVLFVPTASHDYMPYYNSFHKIYTGEFGVKTDVLLTVFKPAAPEKIMEKIRAADLIYVGGGDTLFMLSVWNSLGLTKIITDAFNSGVPIAGLSAGAIFWASKMYTDSALIDEFAIVDGLGWMNATLCPHFNVRRTDFTAALKGQNGKVIAIEDDSMATIVNGEIVSSVGSVYYSPGIDKVELKKI